MDLSVRRPARLLTRSAAPLSAASPGDGGARPGQHGSQEVNHRGQDPGCPVRRERPRPPGGLRCAACSRPRAHPYDELTWERRDAVITNWRDGTTAFEQRDLEFPATWSQNATNIVACKYFRGPLGTPQREHSVRQMVDGVAGTITRWGAKDGYFAADADAEAFQAELTHLLVNQKAAFNSRSGSTSGSSPSRNARRASSCRSPTPCRRSSTGTSRRA